MYRGERPTVAHLLELAPRKLQPYSLATVNRDLHVYVGESKQAFSWSPKNICSSAASVILGMLQRVVLNASLRRQSKLSILPVLIPVRRCQLWWYLHQLPPVQTSGPFDAAVSSLKTKVLEFISRNSTDLLARQVDEMEIRFRIAESPDSPVQVPVRIMATSMSGQWLKVDVYSEYLDH